MNLKVSWSPWVWIPPDATYVGSKKIDHGVAKVEIVGYSWKFINARQCALDMMRQAGIITEAGAVPTFQEPVIAFVTFRRDVVENYTWSGGTAHILRQEERTYKTTSKKGMRLVKQWELVPDCPFSPDPDPYVSRITFKKK